MRGALLLEILLAVMVFSAIGAIAAQALVVSFRGNEVAAEKAAATQLMLETVRAVRAASDESWEDLYGLTHDTGQYHPELQSGKWVLVPGSENLTLGTTIYNRYFTVAHVSRDTTTRAIQNTYVSANDDPSTQKVTVIVSASSTGPISTDVYLSRWRNLVCSQSAWSAPGASGAYECPDTTYTTSSNITPGETLELCSGGC